MVQTIRRFHTEGTVVRLDVGMQLNIAKSASSASATEWFMLLREMLEIPVRVRDMECNTQTLKLIEAGNILAEHYLAATTNRQLNPHVKPQPWWFCSGDPALFIEYPRSQPAPLPPHTRLVLDVPSADATLSHAWLKFDKKPPFSAWFLAMGDKGDPDAVRRLRIHLTRLHAERECLALVLSHMVDGGKLDLANNLTRCNAVHFYLNVATQGIQKTERNGFDQSAMFDVARQAFDIPFEGDTLQITRRQVAMKVDAYIRQAKHTARIINIYEGDVMNTNIQLGNVSVTGDFNIATAKNLVNSFNKAAKAGVDDELREKLKSLAVEVAKLAEKLPLDEAEHVSNDLDCFTTEAVSPGVRLVVASKN